MTETEDKGRQPDSEPARQAAKMPRFTWGERIFIGVLGGIILLAVLVIALMLRATMQPTQPTCGSGAFVAKPQTSRLAHLDNQEFGAAEAKVVVLVLLPLRVDCHAPTVEYLARVAQAHPEHMRIRFVDFLSPHGREEARRLNCACASVVINGSNRFRKPSGEEVVFAGAFGEEYSLEDVRLALQTRLAEAYGSAAPQLPPTGQTATAPH